MRLQGMIAAVAAIAAFGMISAEVALGAVITVDSTANVSLGGACTLPNAITAANTDAAVGGCGAGSGIDTIDFSVGGVIDLSTGDATELPAFSAPVTIAGPGMSQLTVGSATNYGLVNQRVFTLATGATAVTLKDLTIRGGDKVAGANGSGGGVLVVANTGLTLESTRVIGNRVASGTTAASFGGGVGVANSGGATGTVTITYSTIEDNISGANTGDGSGTTGRGFGGGVGAGGGAASVSIAGSTISGNEARSTDNTNASNGGGVSTAFGGALTIVDSTVAGNLANSPNTGSTLGPGGGGIYHNGTAFTLTNSSITSNQAIGNSGGSLVSYAGGVYSAGSSAVLTMSNTTVSANQVMSSGGGMELNGSSASATTISNSTIAGNIATAGAASPAARTGTAGVNMGATRVAMNNVTISGNQNTQVGNTFSSGGISFVGATNFTADNTVIAGNGNPSGALDCRTAFGTPTVDFASYNLVGASGGCAYVVDNTTHNVALGTSPLLGALGANGGNTETMIPQLGSPLLGAGNTAAPGVGPKCSATGQNGITRAQQGAATPGSGCDIGAYAAPRHALTINKVTPDGSAGVVAGPPGEGQIDCGIDCSGQYPENAQVTVTAAPTSPSVFGSWSGISGATCASTSLTCQVPMTAAQTVTATFATPPVLTTSALSDGTVGTPYSRSVTASGANAPLTFTLTGAGTFPSGVTLQADGSVTGTPTTSGTFTFGVLVTNSNGTTATGNVTVTMVASASPPPTLAAAPQSTSLVVAFTPPADPSAGGPSTGYQVSLDDGGTWQTVATSATGNDTRTAIIEGLTPGRTYSVRVRGVNATGAGIASGALLVTTAASPIAPPSPTVMQPPSTVSACPATRTLHLRWVTRRSDTLRRVTIRVNGKLVRTVAGTKRSTTIRLATGTRVTYRIGIDATTTSGRRLRSIRQRGYCGARATAYTKVASLVLKPII
ncbi:MAG: fibronectin type III domain-containing protein [Solirubrobacteraceae bacterium]|nr:fibronectin type III domain-containing protein [Solirubrobacteraceae bacterium]